MLNLNFDFKTQKKNTNYECLIFVWNNKLIFVYIKTLKVLISKTFKCTSRTFKEKKDIGNLK